MSEWRPGTRAVTSSILVDVTRSCRREILWLQTFDMTMRSTCTTGQQLTHWLMKYKQVIQPNSSYLVSNAQNFEINFPITIWRHIKTIYCFHAKDHGGSVLFQCTDAVISGFWSTGQTDTKSRMISDSLNFTITAGQTAVLQCSAEGFPNPHYSWKKGGKVVNIMDRFTLFAGGSLRIERVEYADQGMYTCQASNSGGTDTLSVYLKVHGM